MKKKTSKDNLIDEFKKRTWGMNKREDDQLLEILYELIKNEKKPTKRVSKKRVAKKSTKTSS